MMKRGISTIVATVLIVLITVAAVTILWAALSPLINQNLESGTKCFNVQDSIKIDADKRYTCYNDTGLYVRVERAANSDELAGFQVSVTAGGNTLPGDGLRVLNTDANFPTANGATKFKNLTAAMSAATTAAGTAGDEVIISLAPMAEIDGEATACTASQEITIETC